jgi:hypothetical protein
MLINHKNNKAIKLPFVTLEKQNIIFCNTP